MARVWSSLVVALFFLTPWNLPGVVITPESRGERPVMRGG